MKIFKDAQNKLHEIQQGFEYLLPSDCIEINQTDASSIRLAEIPVKTLDEKKSDAWSLIKSERDRRIQRGGYKVGTKWYHSDTFSRTQQMGLVMLGTNIPTNTPWKTMDGSFVVMTQTLANQIFGTAATSDIAIFTAAEIHKSAMELSNDPATYTFTTGWPIIFGE